MSQDKLNLDPSLLDMSIDDIEDLPGFSVPSNGQYLLNMATSLKDINGATCVQTEYEVVQCIEKDNDSDPDAVVGSKFSKLFTIKGDGKDAEKDKESVKKGLGNLKLLLGGIAEQTGQGNLGVLIRDVVASCLVQATVKRRVDKEDPDKVYSTVKNLQLQ